MIRGNYAMLMMTTEAGLAHPERIRATNMRRFMATMSQVNVVKCIHVKYAHYCDYIFNHPHLF